MKTLGVFGKHPLPGQVKSRLANHLGTIAASRLYAAFLDDLTLAFRNTGERRVLGFWPADSEPFFERFTPFGYELWPQPDGDLGTRIAAFFQEALRSEGDRAVLIGSDSPTLPREYVDRAFDLLETNDGVLGPATDGGYYLVGLRRRAPDLFAGISWSSPTVLSETVDRLTAAEMSLALLPPWYDVDTMDDLRMLAGHICATTRSGQTHPCPLTASVLNEMHLLR
jgi:uncharacterized protein